MIVYKIKNNVNTKIYIGITKNELSKRIATHIRENKTPIQKALNKYGVNLFTISIIDFANNDEVLKEKERYWIKFYNCKVPNGYNLTDGGDGVVNPSKELRKKRSLLMKGKPSIMKGKTHTKEANEKNRLAHLGKHHSEKTKKKQSKSGVKRFKNPLEREKISIAMKNNLKAINSHIGKKDSEKTKQKKKLSAILGWEKRRKNKCI